MIELICECCREKFERRNAEYKRCKKHGYSITCSRSCGVAMRNKVHSIGNVKNLRSNNRLDEFSPFRYYIQKAYALDRVKAYGNSDLTVEYLSNLWKRQKGECPYTKKIMDLPKTTQQAHVKGTPNKASLDRIDSTKGYMQGNVEFVCLAVNLAKSHFSKEEMLEFFGQSWKALCHHLTLDIDR